MIIIYKEISYGINQICSGHNCLVIPVSPQFPDALIQKKPTTSAMLVSLQMCLRDTWCQSCIAFTDNACLIQFIAVHSIWSQFFRLQPYQTTHQLIHLLPYHLIPTNGLRGLHNAGFMMMKHQMTLPKIVCMSVVRIWAGLVIGLNVQHVDYRWVDSNTFLLIL